MIQIIWGMIIQIRAVITCNLRKLSQRDKVVIERIKMRWINNKKKRFDISKMGAKFFDVLILTQALSVRGKIFTT